MVRTGNSVRIPVRLVLVGAGARTGVVLTDTELPANTGFRVATALEAFGPLEPEFIHQALATASGRQAERTARRDGLIQYGTHRSVH